MALLLAMNCPLDTHRSTRTKKISTSTVDDGDEADDAQTVLITTNNSLRWQIDYN